MFHRALKGIGVPSHLYVYPGHAHGNWTLESHLMRANADIAWMGECNQLKKDLTTSRNLPPADSRAALPEHYINGREWAWEEPPVSYTEQPSSAWNPVALQAKRRSKL